jgi:hypothetical protein
MGNIARLYEGEEMSAFDSAMLMIEDLSQQVTELSKHIWELQLAIWHSHLDPRDGICNGPDCQFCKTYLEAFHQVERSIYEA